jgi:alkanesulfonate monooxygenase SsuD/methylene tetrahydromethanopterin reductase-like flavin-dependent oxidoreductase (luciferase family)
MKLGVCSASSGPYTSREALDSLAELAEEHGVESVWVSEDPVLADPRQPPSPMDPGDRILDPVASLGFLALRSARH